jgi:hypothetical protein
MGRLYASEGLWPASDPLLHTSDRAPVPHEWLFQVALHYGQEATGFQGLRVAHALAVAGVLALVFAIFRRAARGVAMAACATAIFSALCWYRLFQLRPDLVTIPATLLLYVLWLAPERGPSALRIALGALLFLVWVNAHSLFAIGLALVVAALLGTGLAAVLGAGEANTQRARRLALALVAGLAVTLVNPRGWAQHMTFFVESEAGAIWALEDDFLRYDPLTPIFGNPAFTPVAWGLMTGLLVAFVATAAWMAAAHLRERSPERLRALDPVHGGLAAAAFVACIVSVRFHWLCVFPLLYLLPRWPSLSGPAALLTVFLAVAIPVQGGFAALAREVAREPDGYRAPWLDARYAGSGARFLADAGLEGRLYNPFNLGGFLGYWLAPKGLRTFIDGRLDHIPAHVLDDYRTVRRTSLSGPTHVLRATLDPYDVDLFFADAFPEAEYPNRQSGYHLRRLREWMLVHAGRTHAIYLRRGPASRANLARVIEYYDRLGVPFDPVRGLDVSRVVREAPAWAERQGLLHPDRERLSPSELAAHAWRVGDFETQVALDRQSPSDDLEARRRLADGLLHLGRFREALRVARALRREHPDYKDAVYLYNVARDGEKAARRR